MSKLSAELPEYIIRRRDAVIKILESDIQELQSERDQLKARMAEIERHYLKIAINKEEKP